MHTDVFLTSLLHVGFSSREAQIYLTLVPQGDMAIGDIAAHAGISRGSCYDVLEALCEKQFVHACVRAGKRRYTAVAPERIRTILSLQAQELAGRIDDAERFLPALAAWYRPPDALALARCRSGAACRTWADAVGAIGVAPVALVEDIALLPVDVVRAIIVGASPHHDDVPADVDVRVIPPEVIPLNGGIAVAGDVVRMFTATAPVAQALDLYSPLIADATRVLFELAWRQAGIITATLAGRNHPLS